MLKIENTEVYGWEAAIRGMRNPMNSWGQGDSHYEPVEHGNHYIGDEYVIGAKDLDLMHRLRKAGTDHRKFMRMITVSCDVVAPLYWWKEYDTYKVGTVANSCSTMHKIHAKKFTLDDFSHDHLIGLYTEGSVDAFVEVPSESRNLYSPLYILENVIIKALNKNRDNYIKASEALKTRDLTDAERKHITAQKKLFWWQMIQLLPSSYNQRRTIMLNYEVLANIYKSRKNHKLDEWHTFCEWIESLPHSELITGKEE